MSLDNKDETFMSDHNYCSHEDDLKLHISSLSQENGTNDYVQYPLQECTELKEHKDDIGTTKTTVSESTKIFSTHYINMGKNLIYACIEFKSQMQICSINE